MKHPNEEIERLLSRLTSRKYIDLSLDRIGNLLNVLGNPQKRLPPVVHVAGTNGKGSLLAYLTAIFETAGYTVNRFTSPYLVRFNEEIYLHGKEISDEYLLHLLQDVSKQLDKYEATYFEAATAAAFLAFAQMKSDIVLLETGLGGRLDATNVIDRPVATAITPISIDHKEFLGDTIAKIAAEKAGIIKENVPCVVGRQLKEAEDVIVETAKKLEAPLHRFDREWYMVQKPDRFFYQSKVRALDFPLPNLAGRHQMDNAATAVACIDAITGFKIADAHIAQGITHAVWPARLQRLTEGNLVQMIPAQAELWLDGGHNPGAGEVLADWIRMQKKPVHVIFGMLKNKDAGKVLASFVHIVASLTAVSIDGGSESREPGELAKMALAAGINSRICASPVEAIKAIVNEGNNDVIILICGSLYLAGNILAQNGSTP